MAKVRSPGDDVLYEGSSLTVRAMTLSDGRRPATEWFDSLDKKGVGQFQAACAVIESSLASSRPTAGRTEIVKASSEGISELRVTKKGSTPPHLRAFFVRQERTIWVASGHTKRQNKLLARDVAEADGIVAEWRQAR